MHVVAAPDKFRGTATAAEVAAAIGRAVRAAGGTCDEVPLADGGEGTLDALGGPTRATVVTGPLGEPVEAAWRLARDTAVIEMAQASGLVLAGGRERNDPVAATTRGTGELISAALDAGARRIVVAVGGSATTDGGLGAVEAIRSPARLRGVRFIVACDVRTRFVDAAELFAPQKGASPAEVDLLRRRLERLADVYLGRYGVDVRNLPGSGAAGGLAGGLAALGAELVGGFDLVAEELDLAERIAGADLVVTGEGFLDEQSFEGKVVGGVAELASEAGVPALAVVGEVVDEPLGPIRPKLEVVSLVARVGRERALAEPLAVIEEAVADTLTRRRPRPALP